MQGMAKRKRKTPRNTNKLAAQNCQYLPQVAGLLQKGNKAEKKWGIATARRKIK